MNNRLLSLLSQGTFVAAGVAMTMATNHRWVTSPAYAESLVSPTPESQVISEKSPTLLAQSFSESTIIHRSTTTRVTQISFTDIDTSYWASSFVYPLAEMSVIEGFPSGMFMPTSGLTYAQFAAILNKAFDLNTVRETTAIRGVSRSFWAYSAIEKAYEMGFLDIANSGVNPQQRLTRLDVLVALAKGLGYTEITSGRSVEEILSIFEDASSIPVEYRVMIAALTERGVIVNYPNVSRLNLLQVVSRSEACSFIYQAMASLGMVEYVNSQYVVSAFLSGVTNVESVVETNTTSESTFEIENEEDDIDRQPCNQGRGNGSEGCDPGNSRPHGGSNDGDG